MYSKKCYFIYQENHPNPGKMYLGTKRQAYLPDNPEGNEVLRMLRVAFDHGLVCAIKSSGSAKKKDRIVWNCIHHKTNTYGGPWKCV